LFHSMFWLFFCLRVNGKTKIRSGEKGIFFRE
jgi:hypothetical protein